MGMAMVVAVAGNDEGPAVGPAAEASRAGCDVPAFRSASGAKGQVGQESDAARVAAQFCHAVAGAGNRHTDGAGVAWAQRRGDDAALHARDAEAGLGSAESAGWLSVGGSECWGVEALKRGSVE